MAALIPLSQQFSAGIPLYETYYKQVDPTYTGRVGASEAALFLKKSGLSDIVLGKIWDLADPEGKGYLDKQGFYVALRLVACAQNGHEVNLSSLNLTVPPPKFVSNTYLNVCMCCMRSKASAGSFINNLFSKCHGFETSGCCPAVSQSHLLLSCLPV
uniref:EH domain-containing protein n=1 Tax=Pavo cristatus TaxID=9049 RepID=A0A8C9FFD2_PAVCR